jgi:SPP1 gp7 family putative phage head morphogenesis protein
VRDSIRIGFVEGETIDQLVRRIRGTRVNQFKDGILEINRRNAEALVRTAVSHTAQSARDDVFAANSDIIKGWRFTATLDSRTSAVCRGLDGKVFDIGKGPKPPRHWNCRSVSVAVLRSWREMGIDIDETPNPANTRASMNGQVPATETYDSWLRKQPVEFQNDVLGVKKAQLFRAGLTLDKFTNRQGDELSLSELARKEADIFKRAGV